ncbi:hypothetical protein BaRGS_00007678, partial [Batillaria attramentaria]
MAAYAKPLPSIPWSNLIKHGSSTVPASRIKLNILSASGFQLRTRFSILGTETTGPDWAGYGRGPQVAGLPRTVVTADLLGENNAMWLVLARDRVLPPPLTHVQTVCTGSQRTHTQQAQAIIQFEEGAERGRQNTRNRHSLRRTINGPSCEPMAQFQLSKWLAIHTGSNARTSLKMDM